MGFLETIAKQEAKRWLSPYVLRGDSIEFTAHSWMGIGSRRLSATVGGYAWYEGQSVKLTSRQMAVTEIGGIKCLYIFSLAELYHEILHPEEAVEQISLF